MFLFFFFKQKTAYEMRISDWSSDVCSSDLNDRGCRRRYTLPWSARACEWSDHRRDDRGRNAARRCTSTDPHLGWRDALSWRDRKSVVLGKSVSVSVDLGGSRTINKKNNNKYQSTEI